MNKYIVLDICDYCDVNAQRVLRKQINDKTDIIYSHPKWEQMPESKLYMLGQKEFNEYIAYNGDSEQYDKCKFQMNCLKYASVSGHINLVKKILTNIYDNSTDGIIKNTMYCACQNGTENVIEYVLDLCGNHEYIIYKLLCAVCVNRNIELFNKLLLKYTKTLTTEQINELFYSACIGGCNYIIKTIINKYINANNDILDDLIILEVENIDTVYGKNIGKNGMNIIEKQLYGACMRGDIEMVKKSIPLINNISYGILIERSLKSGKLEIAELLIKKIIELNGTNKHIYIETNKYGGIDGIYRLFKAVDCCSLKTVRILCEYFGNDIMHDITFAGIENFNEYGGQFIDNRNIIFELVDTTYGNMLKIMIEYIPCAHLVALYRATINKNNSMINWLWSLNNVAEIDTENCRRNLFPTIFGRKHDSRLDVVFRIITQFGMCHQELMVLINETIDFMDTEDYGMVSQILPSVIDALLICGFNDIYDYIFNVYSNYQLDDDDNYE